MAPTRATRGARWAPQMPPRHDSSRAYRHGSEAFVKPVHTKRNTKEEAPAAIIENELTAERMAAPKEIRPPPGLEEFYGSAWEEETYLAIPMPGMMAGDDDVLRKTVRLSCLPNEVTSDNMIQVALEQAGLDKGVVGLSTEPGMCFGQATIICSNTEEAAVLVEHFNGREWNSSGFTVAAQLLSDEVESFQMFAAGFDWQCGWDEQSMQMLGVDSVVQNEAVPQVFGGMSAEASEFVPVTLSADAMEFTPVNMSAEAKEFVPIGMSADVAECAPSNAQEFVRGQMSAAAPEFVPGKMPALTDDAEVAAETDSAVTGSCASEDGDSVSACSGDEKAIAVVL